MCTYSILYKVHVSALDIGHFRVVHEIIIKQIYKTWVVYVGRVGGKVCTRSRISRRGWAVWVLRELCYYNDKVNIVRSMVYYVLWNCTCILICIHI